MKPNRILHVLGVISFFSFPTTSEAQDAALCSPKDQIVFFGNGINTEPSEALATATMLQFVFSDSLTQEEMEHTEFDAAINPTSGFVNDVLESLSQDLATDYYVLFQAWFGLIPMPAYLEDPILDAVNQITNLPSLVVTDSLSQHVDIYKRSILEGKKVLLVPHSQGTFYANQAYSFMTSEERESFGIMFTAHMDSYRAGGYPYASLTDDLAVNLVRLAKLAANLPAPPNGNVTNSPPCDDFFGHNFTECYVPQNSSSRPLVANTSASILRSLTEPDVVAEQGVITVTLTWGAQPDVDLHVFEPNGTHVYYANRTGNSGYLDVDDTSGYGPEHYYAGCENLQTGNYHVGVNYYYGTSPEVANINVRAGLVERNYVEFLSSSVGSSGNNSPVPVANISVTGDAESGFQFAVTQQ